MPKCLIIAGPNGAGKTTFAFRFLQTKGIAHFLNADLIAQGLSPLQPQTQAAKAGRLFLDKLEKQIELSEDFAFETTLSGKSYLKLIDRLRKLGWTVELYYFALPSVEMSRRRVAERVAHGGHDIPEKDIERRFPRSLRNLFDTYRYRVDRCVCYLNSDEGPELVFTQRDDWCTIIDSDHYMILHRVADSDKAD